MTGNNGKYAAMLKNSWVNIRSTSANHRRHIRSELNAVRGLIPLLMKRRNGQRWSVAERAALLKDLRALANLSPYLIPLLMPGGIFMLPLVAYWMDARRNQRKNNREDAHE
jgi:hypothetical protein